MLNGISPKKIYSYQILTLGFYFFYWCSKSRGAINQSAKRDLIPSTWLLVVPFANYWWMWRYSQALEFVTYKRIKASDVFLLYLLAAIVPIMIVSAIPYGYDDSPPPADWERYIVVIAVVVLIAAVLSWIIGAAFFCAILQGKINRLKASPPASRAS